MKIIPKMPNFWVMGAMILLAVVLAVVNNLRVYDEQRVPWFGSEEEEILEEDICDEQLP